MFTLISAAVLALATSVVASPIERLPRQTPNVGPISSLNPVSFNGWGGFSCLDNFDHFYGVDNFSGCFNTQTVLEQTVVCESVDISVIQQQLSIITEFAKRIVTTQICQVEVQTIVWSQFVAGFQSFSEDIRHVSSRHVGFDTEIASHITEIVNQQDVINTSDFGFLGSDIGSNFINVGGFNWVDGSSEHTVSQAFQAVQVATIQSSQQFSSSSSFDNFGSSGFGSFHGSPVSVGSF